MTEMGELSVEDQLRRERDWAREERDLLAAELASTGVGEYIVANQKLAKKLALAEDERDLLGRQQQALLNLCANAEATGRLIHHEQIYQLLTTDPGDAS